MTRTPEINVGLDLSHEGRTSELGRIVDSRAKTRGIKPPVDLGDPAHYFRDAFFCLQDARLFRDAGPARRRAIRVNCARTVLREAYFVEKSGLAYCARMLLEAETTDSRQTFAQMAGDEATHLAWITPYVFDHERTGPYGPFLRLIVDLIEGGPPAVLIYALQVVLEGWGLSHYRSLAGACDFGPLHKVFNAIRRDEAYHHKTGHIMLDPEQLGPRERDLVVEAMASFLELPRAGPLGVMAAISECNGGFDVPTLATLFEDLSGAKSAAAKLGLLRRLMDVEGMEWVVASLDERGLFLPVSPMTAARSAHSAPSGAP